LNYEAVKKAKFKIQKAKSPSTKLRDPKAKNLFQIPAFVFKTVTNIGVFGLNHNNSNSLPFRQVSSNKYHEVASKNYSDNYCKHLYRGRKKFKAA
jgi:hypothetical protein